MRNKERFTGIIPPIITPLTGQETLHESGLAKLIEHCIHGGVSGLFVNGTSGEAMRVTDKIWQESMQRTLQYTADRVPVFCGAIDSSTGRVLEKLKQIEDAGGRIAVITPPFYLSSFGQDEIFRHFDILCRATKLEIAVYNIPETTHANMLPETVAKLADYENIVLYKDSTTDWQQLQRALFLLADKDIAVLNGAEELCAVAMLFGAQGCIPGLANFEPQLFVRLHAACRKGDIAASHQLQKDIWQIRKILFVSGCWMSSMKYLAELYGFGERQPSQPLLALGADEQQYVQNILREHGLPSA